MNEIFSTGQVARRLAIQPYRITYAISNGSLPDASFRFIGKRCFSEDDVQRIADHFGVETTQETQQERRLPEAD
ncbi:hypothetical protein OAG68_00120 [bacterium]|nr:hypothetical protein [bacterium]